MVFGEGSSAARTNSMAVMAPRRIGTGEIGGRIPGTGLYPGHAPMLTRTSWISGVLCAMRGVRSVERGSGMTGVPATAATHSTRGADVRLSSGPGASARAVEGMGCAGESSCGLDWGPSAELGVYSFFLFFTFFSFVFSLLSKFKLQFKFKLCGTLYTG
jgi:hypothetical protein